MQSSKNKKTFISCFDLDDTLIVGNSSFRFYFYLCKKGIFPLLTLPIAILYFLRFQFFKLSVKSLHEKIFAKLLKGKLLARIEEHVVPFLEKELSLCFYKPAISKLQEAKKMGHLTVILSSSPSFLVKKISEYLQVDRWFASHYLTDEKGRLERIEHVILGEDKKNIVERLIADLSLSLSHVAAYSDSILDLPLLESVGKTVAVRPDNSLSRLCKKRAWDIL